jgi:hypothetical protein
VHFQWAALVACLVVTACSAAVPLPTVAPSSTTQARVASPTPFDATTLNYPTTARAFVDAVDAGRFDEAIALLDEHFAFGGDCDYENLRLWNIADLEYARTWLQALIADRTSIQIVKFVDVPSRDHALGLEIIRSSDSIRAAYPAGVVRPQVPMVMHFSLDGRRIQYIAFAWSTPVANFRDCD